MANMEGVGQEQHPGCSASSAAAGPSRGCPLNSRRRAGASSCTQPLDSTLTAPVGDTPWLFAEGRRPMHPFPPKQQLFS